MAGGYAGGMSSDNSKMLLFVAWAIAVCLAAFAFGITSVSNWIAVVLVAVVPPVVVRRFWHAPEQTISESINEARR
jgi:predicted MFS family arabinose efflux permease